MTICGHEVAKGVLGEPLSLTGPPGRLSPSSMVISCGLRNCNVLYVAEFLLTFFVEILRGELEYAVSAAALAGPWTLGVWNCPSAVG